MIYSELEITSRDSGETSLQPIPTLAASKAAALQCNFNCFTPRPYFFSGARCKANLLLQWRAAFNAGRVGIGCNAVNERRGMNSPFLKYELNKRNEPY